MIDTRPSDPPLIGLRVLDLTRVLAGPLCTMMLGDLGAEVIKVEKPGAGDDTREWGPPFTGGESAYYLSVNRNKKSITVNFKSEAGRKIIKQLASQVDVLVENWRIGTMEEWGLGYKALRALNPGLIYCAITGYGQNGPDCKRPGYDFIIQAEGGLMSITGPVDGQPTKVGVAIVDQTAGMFATISILAALYERSRSGIGQYIDISLLDSQLAWLANVASNYFISGNRPGRFGNAHPNIVPYELFSTADSWIALGVGNDRQWELLCNLAGWEDLIENDRFATNPGRVKNRDELIPLLQERFQTRVSQEWLDLIQAAGIPCGSVNNIDEIFRDPQVLARQMLQELPHPTAGTIKMVGSPLKLSRTPVRIDDAPPLLGQHTEVVLRQYMGYTSQDIRQLREEGAI
jgi:formyl-CoA transferase